MNSSTGRSPGSPIGRRRRSPHFRQWTSTCIAGTSGSLRAGRAFLDSLRGAEEGLARAGGEHADRNGLRHALALLHEERGPDEAPLAVRRRLELVVPVVVVEVAVNRREVDLPLLGMERPLHLRVRLP